MICFGAGGGTRTRTTLLPKVFETSASTIPPPRQVTLTRYPQPMYNSGVLLQVHGISKSYGTDVILDRISLRIESREKVALVGRNGIGKSTFVRILVGEEESDGGSIQWANGARFGYLSQHSRLNADHTVLQSAEEARRHLLDMEARLRELERALESNPTEAELEEYSLLQAHFHDQEGWNVGQEVRRVLSRMGFEDDALDKKVDGLSGGEKTRLTLARLLLEEPDLLILDEPTNHLDLEATEWLEKWLKHYSGAVLFVSHDRVFLERVAERVIELRAGEIKSYDAGFEKYLLLKEAENAYLATLADKQQAEIDKLDEYVRRFMNSQRTAQARGRQKRMIKLQASAVSALSKERGIRAALQARSRTGDIVFETRKLSVRFWHHTLLNGLDWTVRWGERWGVIGSNGAGKSTLCKVLLGDLEPSEGQVKVGSNVQLGSFAQDAQNLDLNRTAIQTLNAKFGLNEGEARNLCGRFLLSGDDAQRPVGSLSGGERNKLQLAVLTAMQPNVLLLDEPTNHLDIESREALAEILNEFNGVLILISHDRWLLNEVCEQTLNILPNTTEQYPGTFDEYRAGQSAAARPQQTGVAAQTAPQTKLSQHEISKQLQKSRKRIDEIEAQISAKESESREIETLLSSPGDPDEVIALSQKHADVQGELASLMDEWAVAGQEQEHLLSLRTQ